MATRTTVRDVFAIRADEQVHVLRGPDETVHVEGRSTDQDILDLMIVERGQNAQ